MSFENLVGLHVTDQSGYQQYRAKIMPILHSYGGDFRYDFKIADVLVNGSPHAINRVFVIGFTDQIAKEKFFADPAYLQIRKALFETSVDGVSVIAEFVR
jgi:uncharacterized protein (DUF1330 family)